MKIQRIFLLTVSFLVCLNAFGQYVNTDELIFIEGENQPISPRDYTFINDSVYDLNRSFLASFRIPGEGGNIISRFGPRSGRMHYGTDIKMSAGDTVFASQNGTIIRANWGYGFGNLIVIQHKNNIQTYYAHLSKFIKKEGEHVKTGEAIGLAGSTGRARGSHLHFEMRENEKPFDPEMVFDFENQQIRNEAENAETLSQLHRVLRPKGYGGQVAIPEFYSVRSGDSLWVISRRFKVSITEICRLNKISENSVLQIGQPLRMF